MMKIAIKYSAVVISMIIITAGCFTTLVKAQQQFDKAAFYSVMELGNLKAVNSQIEVVKASSLNNKDGYEGALLMRKAGKEAIPKQKLKYFKEGRIKLENAIRADTDNIEYRFLRLTIEENAPKIVKYRNDIEKDKTFVLKNYKSLSSVVQQAIKNYSKKSKVLHSEEFLTL